ncbi:MAG: hypothetical protein K2W92_06380 [Alphaproteobacteria bacterium]|nr:hypothetical protein [Alphaproteobacteria bacterium]
MRKKLCTLSACSLFDKNFLFLLLLVMALMIIFLKGTRAVGESKDIPGLPIARLSLPAISASTYVVKPTGTQVGEKATEYQKMIQDIGDQSNTIIRSTRNLYEQAITTVNTYHLIVSKIEAKLQLGTTPSNPQLVALEDKALQRLDQIEGMIAHMDELAIGFFADSQQVETLSFQIEDALHLPGAVDEDHAHLFVMSEELKKVSLAITQVRTILIANATRQKEWLSSERIRFATLSSSISKGKNQILCLEKASVYPIPTIPSDVRSQAKMPPSFSHSPAQRIHNTQLQKDEYLKTQFQESNSLYRQAKNSQEQSSYTSIESGDERLETQLQESNLLDIPDEEPLELISSEPLSLVPPLSQEAKEENHPVLAESSPPPPLPQIAIPSPPPVQPLSEEEPLEEIPQIQTKNSEQLPSYASIENGRFPLAVLEPNQDLRNHKWYIFSSAKRGLKGPQSIVEIVSLDTAPQRGEEIKSLLIEMGISPTQIRVINTESPENKTGQVHIFCQP